MAGRRIGLCHSAFSEPKRVPRALERPARSTASDDSVFTTRWLRGSLALLSAPHVEHAGEVVPQLARVIRDGADLFCRVPISMVQAALGGEFAVRTLDGGDAKVRIPEGAQSGRQLKLRGKGMPVLRSRDFGDLYIQAVVETPQNLTRRQRELLLEFDAESSQKTHPESTGFFAKMKEFFEGLG